MKQRIVRILSACGAALACTLVAIGTAGCRDHQACELDRMKMQSMWADLKHTAGKLKVPLSYEELPAKEKEARRAQWEPVEQKVELLRSSFETKQITWNAADRARTELTTLASTLPADGKPLSEGFRRQLESANVEYENLKHKCR